MATKVCEQCAEELPIKMFWGEHRKRMKVCTPCRRKEARRAKRRRARMRELQAQKREEIKRVVQEQDRKMRETAMYAGVLELNKIISRIDNKLKKYSDKVAYCEGSARTEAAIEYQWKRRAYYQEIKDLLYADAARGIDRPLEFYLSNTYLLHKHGFPVVVIDAHPDEDIDNADS